MARLVREVRRGEILDSAERLFLKQGFEKTTINDVIADAGVSKGGFYHHFGAKEDLLSALTQRLTEQSIARFGKVLQTPGLDGLARLNAFFALGRTIKKQDAASLAATYAALFKPEHRLLYNRIYAAMSAVMAPVLAQIIEQGRRERLFKVSDALAAAEIILHVSAADRNAIDALQHASGKAAARDARKALDERLRFQGVAVDRILGLPDGSVDFVGSRASRLAPA